MNTQQQLKNIIKYAIKPFCSLFKNQEEEKKKYIIKYYNLPQGLPTIDLLDLLPGFSESIDPYAFLEGGSLVIDLAIIKALARQYPHCCYLEIGTWRGESVANVAAIAKKCVSISYSDEEMHHKNISDAFIKTHKIFSADLPNVIHIGHDSHSFDYLSLNQKFDLIFIDGDHSYEGVRVDTQKVFTLLRDENSVIIWHDYGFSPESVRWSVFAGILDGIPSENRKNLYHISNSLLAIYKKCAITSSFTSFPQTPNKKFSVTLSAEKL